MELGTWGPFVGREPEVERVGAALRSQTRAGALVVGAGGVGKTRLAREVADAWTADGGEVFLVGGTESGRRISFAALAGIVDDLDGVDFGKSTKRLLDALDRAKSPLLVVDDAHLLDDASATLIHRLALAPGARRPVLVTVAEGRTAPDAVTALRKDGLVEVVELGPLASEQVAMVVEALLGGSVEVATTARMAELSGGNPLVVHELVDSGRADGTLARRRDLWSWRGRVPSNPRLEELVAHRVEHLDPEVRRVLEFLALAEPLTLEELEAAAGTRGLVAAEAAGLVRVERDRARVDVRISQPLYADLVRAGLGQVQTIGLLRELGAVLRAFPASGPADQLKRALIQLEAGQHAPDDAETFTSASRLARPDYELAERFARAALELGGGFTAADYLLDALLWQGRLDEARQIAESVGDDLPDEDREYFALRWPRMLWWMTGERPSESVLEEADLSDRSSLPNVARQLGMAAAAGRALEAVPTALAILADPRADDETRCWASGAAVLGLGGQGRLEAALALSDGAYECARRLTDFNYRLLLSIADMWLRRLAGDLDGMRGVMEDLRRAGTSSPPTGSPRDGLVVLFDALAVLTSGAAARAVPLLRDAAAMLEEIDFGGLSASARFWLAEAKALVGDSQGAAAELVLGVERESRTLEMFRPEQLLARAWACVGSGDRKLASVLLEEAAQLAASQGQQLVEVRIRHAGVRLGSQAAARRLVALASAVEGPFAAAAGSHARALASGDPAALGRAAAQFAEIGASAECADALAQAARAADRAGDEAGSRALAQRAVAVAEAAGGLHTPSLRSLPHQASLTRRQRDVVLLAASGLSSKAIADRLGVGVRTVESHLEAAYRRLGISSRAELATVVL